MDLALLQVRRDSLLRRSHYRRSSKRPKAPERRDGTSDRPTKPAQRLSAPSRPLWLETPCSRPRLEIFPCRSSGGWLEHPVYFSLAGRYTFAIPARGVAG